MEPILSNFLRHGSADPLPERRPFRAGPFSLIFEAGDLRYVKLGQREVIRRLYGAVRDRKWGTVPAEISDLISEDSDQAFRITYTATHRRDDIHFIWQAEIAGQADGSIRFSFDGEAKSTFLRNRIGLCVLHPLRECAGAHVRTLQRDGSLRALAFPRIIAEQQPVPGFQDLAGLAHEIDHGLWAELEFNGDTFETEDQRNWIDASFKTYGTPLNLPRPVKVTAGTRVRQSVTLRLRTDRGEPVGDEVTIHTLAEENNASSRRLQPDQPPVTVRLNDSICGRLPELGLGMASHCRPLTEREIGRLARMGIAHLRADIRLADPRWTEALRLAARDALELGAALELALHLPADQSGDLTPVAKALARLKADPIRALILRDGQKSTPADDLAAARLALADCGMAIGAGTAADLYQLNLRRPPADADFICWSMNPQVHANDLTSIAETPEAAAQQVLSAREYFGDVPLIVSPITLKPRFNPLTEGEDPPSGAGELPPQVDPRQMSLFGAAWTLATLAALAPIGVESLTLFETTGWRGVMETEAGSPLPAGFPSLPGAVFPLYHVLADLGEFAGGDVLDLAMEPSAAVAAIAVRKRGATALWLANLTREPRQVRLFGLPAPVNLRRLDETNVLAAMTEPEAFRRTTGQAVDPDAELLNLAAFSLVCLRVG